MRSYNYGMDATRQKIQTSHSRGPKYTSRLFLNLFKFFFVLLLFLLLTGMSIGIGVIKGIIDNAPDVDPLSFGPRGFATKVYDSQGNLTDTLVMSGSNREAATFEELPQDLLDAFVAIEDSRFWTHNGIDLRSIARAAVGVLTDDYAGGGSTLTQQLIKNNVFEGGGESSFGALLERKFQEQYLAVQLEQTLTQTTGSTEAAKQRIITDYLNTINLGNNTLGVKVAAKRYFNKEVSQLTLSECTVIAGITQNPAKLNPISGRERNEEKRKVILQYMYEQGFITKEEQEEALADDVYDRIQNVNLMTQETSSPYSYFTDELVEQVMEALVTQLSYTETQAHNLLYGGGLSIHTTQDPTIQAIVDEEVNNPENYDTANYSLEYRLSVTHPDGSTEHFSEKDLENFHHSILQDQFDGLYSSQEAAAADVERFKASLLSEGDTVLAEHVQYILQPQLSFVIMDQATGQVKAICGGRGEKTASLTLNRATNTPRQPGSAFKVVSAFAPALDACGATLGTVYYDAPYTVTKKTFRNWWGQQGYLGYSSIRDGIIYSMNIVAVRCLMETVTPQLGVEYAKNLGITTLTNTDLNAATALGGLTVGVTNIDLTSAFAAIANNGTYNKPQFFTSIEDHNGKVLIQISPETYRHRALKDSTAFLLTDAMSASMQSNRKFARPGVSVNSTSTRAALSNMSCAGKSGTTTANNDIWFVGFTPYYTAGVWGGCDNNQKLTSTSFHKDVWRKIMERVHEGLPDPGFPQPESIETAVICRKSGKLAVNGVCGHDPRGNATYTEYFARGTVPTEVCDKHIVVTVCAASGQKPTAFCPLKQTKVCLALPQNETGDTDDSVYGIPGDCTIHDSISTIIDPSLGETDPAGPGDPVVNPYFGPGYVPQAPISDGRNAPTMED